MKNKLKYLICLLALILLSACGGVVKTDMSFDDSFSGSRVMTYTISNADYTSYVQKDLATVESTLKELCPPDIEITSLNQDENNIVATFTINFTSKDEYEEKIGNILKAVGSDIIPKVTFLRSNTAFAKGVAYQENFGSDDLLKWMSDGIIQNNYITSSYETYIFSSDYISLHINGDEYAKDSTMSIIDVNSAKYLPINSVDFNTVINKDSTVDRTIEVNIPDSTYKEAKDDIDQFMSKRVGNIGSGKWVEKDGSHIFTIEGKALSLDDCKQMTENFTGKKEDQEFPVEDESATIEPHESTASTEPSDSTESTEPSDSSAQDESTSEAESKKADSKKDKSKKDKSKKSDESTDASESDSKDDEAKGDIDDTLDRKHLFSKNIFISENINLEDYISNSDNAVRFNYYVNPQNNYGGDVIDAAGMEQNLSMASFDSDKNELLFSGNSSLFDISMDVNIVPTVSKYKHIVTISPTGKIKRNITVVFKDSFTDEDTKTLEDNLKKAFADTKIKVGKLALKGKDLEVKITSVGTLDEDVKMWEKATDYDRNSADLDIDKKGYLADKQKIRFTDDFTPEIFTLGTIGSYEYRVKGIGKPSSRGDYFGGGFDDVTAKFKGNDFVVKGDNVAATHISFPDFTSVRTNYFRYLIFAAAALIAILILVIVVIVLIKKSKKKKAQAGESTQVDTGNKTVFCPHCGAKNNQGDKFCSSCGKEIT